MVIFDVLASHHRMLLWHESSVENLLKETADLQRAEQQAEGHVAESSSQTEQNRLQDAPDIEDKADNQAEVPGTETDTAPAEGMQSANLPLDRR